MFSGIKIQRYDIFKGLLVLLVICLLLNVVNINTVNAAIIPTVSTTRMAFDSDRSGNYEIYTMPKTGGSVTKLTNNTSYDSWWPRISPNRQKILFYRTPVGVHDTNFTLASLWIMNANGTNQTLLRAAGTDGWQMQGHAEWSPDGTRILMFGGSTINPQIYHTNASGTAPFQVTNRGGMNLDPSWSPDGTQILFIGCPNSVCNLQDYELYTTGIYGGVETRLTYDTLRDQDPYFSPNGTTIAFLTERPLASGGTTWDIRMAQGGVISWFTYEDNSLISLPQWTSDSQWVYYHKFVIGGSQWQIYRKKFDLSTSSIITSGHPGNNEYVSL